MSKVPNVVLELPEGDTRTAKVFWVEAKGDTLHVCITVDDDTAPQAGNQPAPVLEDAALWFAERDNVLHSFWVLLGAAETRADNDNDPLLKHQVEGFYRQWNALNGTTLNPRWVSRAARK